jgi:hypothetical protein
MESEKKGKKGIDYSKGKIYRIVCDTTGLVYIGSTVETLSNRLSKHKNNYKNYLKGKNNYITSFDILKNDNYKIILIENYSCINREELEREERKYIETIECVNKIIPGRTDKEYYEDNKDKIKKYEKEYRKNNKDKLKEKNKIYREENKDKIKELKNKWYKTNKQEINKKKIVKIECEFCKSITTKNHFKRHQQSLKCKKFQSLVIED